MGLKYVWHFQNEGLNQAIVYLLVLDQQFNTIRKRVKTIIL